MEKMIVKLLPWVLLVLLAWTGKTQAGEHLSSWHMLYNYEAAPRNENFRSYNIPNRPSQDGWLAFHIDLFPPVGPPLDPTAAPLYVRVAIIDTSNGAIYYYGLVKAGENREFTFPTMVHSFHPLVLHIKCVNLSYEPVQCTGYIILYGK